MATNDPIEVDRNDGAAEPTSPGEKDDYAISTIPEDDTISEIPARHRPTAGLTRNLSEMSIECSTANRNGCEPPPTLDDEIVHDNSSNRLLIVRNVFELPPSETLVNGYLDLKCIVKIEPSKLKKFGIRLTTNTHSHHTIIADSELSQREWLDELRKGVFVAQHAGNSVRIVLPFSKIMTVDKPSVFQFAANIRIKLQEDMTDTASTAAAAAAAGEDYYFAFFPDIEEAYQVITDTWKRSTAALGSSQRKVVLKTSKPAAGAGGSGSFLSFDSFLENISPAALPTMLMGKLMSVTNVFQQPSSTTSSNNTTAEEEESVEEEQKQHFSSRLPSIRIPYVSTKKKDEPTTAAATTTLTTSPNEMSSSSLASRLKRNSLFFNKSNTVNSSSTATGELSPDASPTQSPPPSSGSSQQQQDYFRGAEQPEPVQPITITKSRPLSGPYSLSKIPRAVTDAIKHQVLRSEPTATSSNVPTIEPPSSSASSTTTATTTSEQDQSTTTLNPNNNRNRSSSLSAFKQHISPYYLYSKINGSNSSSNTLPAPHISDTLLTNAATDISLVSDADSSLSAHTTQTASKTGSMSKRHRAKTMGTTLISGTLNKLTPGSTDYYFQQQHINESQHRHPKGPIWLSDKMMEALEEASKAAGAAAADPLSDSSDSLSASSGDEEQECTLNPKTAATDPKVRQEEQRTINEHLNANFPMLLETEDAEAVIKASFWRTIPYSGKIYITDHYFCFNSKILAGQQKLIVPWRDVIQVNKIRTKSYYLLHGMTMIVKDMADEIYLDFSSVELRDHCYAICELKTEDGPPLLSTSAKLSKPTEESKHPERPMHFTCLTIGSRGDVQPYVALCKELQKDGHTCRIATHPEYENWITQHGIEFRSIGGDPGELMFYSWFESLLESSYKACQSTDVIIESPSAMVGVHMAEKLGVPYFRSMPFPFTRTTKFPHPFASQSTAGGRIYNDMTYVMIDMALWAGTSKYVNRFRRNVLELPSTNLDRLELWRVPYVYSFSPSVVHPPKDWPDYIHCTGYWFLDNPDTKWKPDEALVEFLHNPNDPRPIVYIGFGSIIVPDAVETTRVIVDSVLKADVRAIVCKGWSARVTTSKVSHRKARSAGDMELIKQEEVEQEEDSEILLDQHPGTIYHVDSVPHDWLFPQIQGVVHHGGAGTTAAGLRAGLPTVIKPFFGDQRFWGQRIEELQVGICLNKLMKNQLIEALKTITQNTTMIAKASKIGETIRKVSDKVGCGVHLYTHTM
ncbi:hypothetical protein [Parasitella parasitica]|uniref:GRAM domain-containing protein n=1 Tax=Parasitella parasitica TaxID=35722 RepID=A0A0B7N815_9FUNG|nr:hypothetical protein [Parasitella parasitica]